MDDIDDWSDAKLIWAKVAILWCLGSGIFTFLMFVLMLIVSIVRAI